MCMKSTSFVVNSVESLTVNFVLNCMLLLRHMIVTTLHNVQEFKRFLVEKMWWNKDTIQVSDQFGSRKCDI